MKKIYLNYEHFTEEIVESNEAYGHWERDNHYSNYFFSNDSGEEEFVLDFEPVNNTIYLLYGIYSSGDSFGCSQNEREHFMIFKTEEEAKKVQFILETIDKLNNPYYHIFGLTPKKKKEALENLEKEIEGYFVYEKNWCGRYNYLHNKKDMYVLPWGDYFTPLNYIDIMAVEYLDN